MKHTRESIKRRAKEILGECYELVPGMDALDLIRFTVSGRMTRSAGRANVATSEIQLSLPYFEDEGNFDTHLRETVTHEIAHILSPPTRRHGSRKRSTHGFAWKIMHRRLGGKGERCHELALAAGHERKARGRAVRTDVPCSKCHQPISLGPTQLKRHRTQGATYRHAPRCP